MGTLSALRGMLEGIFKIHGIISLVQKWQGERGRRDPGGWGMGIAREQQISEYIRKLYLIATDMLYGWL